MGLFDDLFRGFFLEQHEFYKRKASETLEKKTKFIRPINPTKGTLRPTMTPRLPFSNNIIKNSTF